MVNDTLSAITEANARISSAVYRKSINELSGNTFSVFINSCKWNLDIPRKVLEEASSNILSVLITGCLEKESQTLAATAFCSVKAYLKINDPAGFVDCVVTLLTNESYENCKLFLCNGITHLRTEYFTANFTEHFESRETLLQCILEIVYPECRKLNTTTYLAFDTLDKIVSIVCSVRGKNNFGISLDCLKPLLHIVMSNFENPIPGVRQKNFSIIQNLLYFYYDLWEGMLPKLTSIYNVGHYETDIQYRSLMELVLTHLPWTMKSKYFLLRIICQSSTNKIFGKCYGEELIQGLLFSLSTSHLVSAGEDLYKATLVCDLDEWIHWYSIPVTHIISNPSLSLDLENLINYWFQRPCSIKAEIVDYLLKEVPSINLYSYISLLKLSRKGGYSSFDWETVDEQRLKVALEDYSDKIRSQAFSLICTTNKTSIIPTKAEFGAVRQFLKHNINSDNASFRQKFLSSFTDFSIRIRDFILTKQKGILLEQDVALTHCFAFLDWLHSFFIFNLEIKSNYQRKITTLELYNIILTYFGTPVEDIKYKRKSNKAHLNLKAVAGNFSWIYMFESEIYQQILLNCIFDEDSNVRDLSVKLLLNYFAKCDYLKLENFEDLFQIGLSLCSNQIFYKAESGALMIYYLLTLTEKSSRKDRYIDYNRTVLFLDEFLSSAEEQFDNLQKDMLEAISKGSFLYGTLQVIRFTGTGRGALVMKSNHLKRTLLLLEKVIKYFMSVLSSKSVSNLDNAPSFGEMGEAISDLVNKSSLKEYQVGEERSNLITDSVSDLHLSPAQQLVLNCIWLNLKECSMLCSKLVESQNMDYESTEHCVLLVVSILHKCRHKGAIEAAGLALSKIIEFLTRQPYQTKDGPRYLSLPEQLMDNFLDTLVSSNSKTVSRRSAGLAILVHKLIAADVRQSKPLLPRCMTFLLELAKKEPSGHDFAILVDLPQSQAMHIVRALVQDAGLKLHLLPYYLDICVVTLTNLASPFWTIRNAALQLLGAFVPKLVGQKPQEEEDGKSNQYLMFEELYAHAKPLINMLLDDFALAAKSNSLVVHSKLMPILTLVTNLNVGLQRILASDVSKIVVEFQEYFQQLFKSCIVNVRKLSAKAHAQFLSVVELIPTICRRCDEIMHFLDRRKSVISSNNELHGYLLNITYLVRRFDGEKLGMKLLLAEESILNERLSCLTKSILSGPQSYFLKSIVFEWKRFTRLDCDVTNIYNNIIEIPIGFPHFVEKHLAWQISILKGKELEDTVAFCVLKCPLYDVKISCLNSLKTLLKSECNSKSKASYSLHTIFLILKDFVLECPFIELISLSIEIMFYALENMKISFSQPTTSLLCEKFISYSVECFSSNKCPSSTITYMLPVVCGMLTSQKIVDFDYTQTLAGWIKSRCDPVFDQDIRIHAAKAMTILVPVLKSDNIIGTSVSEIMWKACIDCLQDEISEVRYEASQFVTHYFEDVRNVRNPFVSLEHMFKLDSITKFMLPVRALEILWKKMISVSSEGYSINGIKNPFDHEKKNIFAEEGIVSYMAYQTLLELAKSSDCKLKSKLEVLCKDFAYSKYSSSLSNYVKEIKNYCP